MPGKQPKSETSKTPPPNPLFEYDWILPGKTGTRQASLSIPAQGGVVSPANCAQASLGKVRSTNIKLIQPLKWPGGKHFLAKWIISFFPAHLHFVEPFCGGCAVLLARDPNRDWLLDEAWRLENGDKLPAHLRGGSEIVNDVNGALTNFWKVLADEKMFSRFERIMQAIPFSQDGWNQCNTLSRGAGASDPGLRASGEDLLTNAVWFFVRARQSMAGRMNCFTPLTRNRTRGGRNAEANAWWNGIEGLPEVHERLKGVVILNDDACNVIQQQDGNRTLVYCDPPYLHTTRSSTGEYGEFEMSVFDHARLLMLLSNPDRPMALGRSMALGRRKESWSDDQWSVLESYFSKKLKGKFILSGYPSELYEIVSKAQGWYRADIEIDNKASSSKKKKKKIECLWANYKLEQE